MSEGDSREDFLTEDAEIPSQRWVLLSFLSPENVLSRKDTFMFNSFLKQYEMSFRSQNLEKFLVKQVQTINEHLEKEAIEYENRDLSGAAQACRKSQIRMEDVLGGFQEFVKKNQKELSASKLQDEFDEFLFKNKVKLEDDFYAANQFRTTVRGLKIRGSYSQKEEAEARAKKLQRSDPLHNIFVGEVGKWLPWDPSPNDIKDQEYAEDELNTLMKKYKENEEARELFHQEQRKAVRGSKKQMTITREDGAAATAAAATEASSAASGGDIPSLGTATATDASQFAGMWSGPADLAIARKMEKKGE
jgi:hypothetical protein